MHLFTGLLLYQLFVFACVFACFRLFCLFVRFLFDWLAMLVRLLTGASVYMFAALEAFRLFAMFFPSLLSSLLSICSFYFFLVCMSYVLVAP